MAKELFLLHTNQVVKNLRFKSAAPIVRRSGGPGGVSHLATMSRCQRRWVRFSRRYLDDALLVLGIGCNVYKRPACCFQNVVPPLICCP